MAGTVQAWAWRRLLRSSTAGADQVLDPAEPRLVGAPEQVGRLRLVQPGTVAVLLGPGLDPALRRPGDLLLPPLLRRRDLDPTVVVLSTAPVQLDVTVTGLATFDGYALDRVVLRVSVQLHDGDDHAALLDLAAEHGLDLEATLLSTVRRETAAAVQGAVRMNRLADLRRLSLLAVLQGRWLPPALVGGVLACRQASVEHVGWPDARLDDEPTVPVRVGSP